MSKTKIPLKIQNLLWAQSGGRCEYDGCNRILYRDLLTKIDCNSAYIAHIVADSADGPRGDIVRSPLLAKDIKNLMLLCDTHHRLIDKEQVEEHPESLLLKMKTKHDERIEKLTGIVSDKNSTIIWYGANIGDQSAVVSYRVACKTIVPEYYPAYNYAIELGLKNSGFQERDKLYWEVEEQNLTKQFKEKISNALEQHFSLFALAPQPLLVKLGTLFSDMYSVDVYQKHREPDTWEWQDLQNGNIDNPFILNTPSEYKGKVVLILALSAPITERIKQFYIKEKTSVWEITIEKPQLDFLQYSKQLVYFRNIVREVFKDIKQKCPNKEIYVHMAMPNACAVEFGRGWMHKVDADLVLYDTYNDKENEAIIIKHS